WALRGSEGRVDVAGFHVDAFQLGVVVDGDGAVLAADAGLLVAAHRHFHRAFVVGVDPADAGLQLRHHAMPAGQVTGEHTSGQAVGRVVGALDDFSLVVEVEHGHHRAENFFTHDGHVVAAVGEDGRLDEAAGIQAVAGDALAAVQQRGTVALAGVDVV